MIRNIIKLNPSFKKLVVIVLCFHAQGYLVLVRSYEPICFCNVSCYYDEPYNMIIIRAEPIINLQSFNKFDMHLEKDGVFKSKNFVTISE